eukprot:COSAG04_NODE_8181_length_1010_cov_1.380900_1_plen_187_part_10
MANVRLTVLGAVSTLIYLAEPTRGQTDETAAQLRCDFPKMQGLLRELVNADLTGSSSQQYLNMRDSIIADPDYDSCVRVVDQLGGHKVNIAQFCDGQDCDGGGFAEMLSSLRHSQSLSAQLALKANETAVAVLRVALSGKADHANVVAALVDKANVADVNALIDTLTAQLEAKAGSAEFSALSETVE